MTRMKPNMPTPQKPAISPEGSLYGPFLLLPPVASLRKGNLLIQSTVFERRCGTWIPSGSLFRRICCIRAAERSVSRSPNAARRANNMTTSIKPNISVSPHSPSLRKNISECFPIFLSPSRCLQNGIQYRWRCPC